MHLAVEISSLKPLFSPEPRSAHKPPSDTVVMCVGMIRSGEHSPSEHGMLYHWLGTFTTIAELWVTIRGFSFARSFMELYKQREKKTLEKSKALRKTLN